MDTVYLPRNGDNMSPDCKFTAPSGKAFLKWTYVYDGDTYEILPGDTFNGSDVSTITLTAQWSKKVTFTFVPGAGSVKSANGVVAECEGAEFDYWYRSEDCSTYPGYTSSAEEGVDSVTVTAHWW